MKSQTKRINLLLMLMLLATLGVSQPKQLILKDNFADNRNKWWIGKTESGSCIMEDDKYYVEYHKDKSWTTKIDVALDQDQDFAITANLAKIEGTNQNGFGITWGKGEYGYYTFIITGAGKYYVRRVDKGSEGQYLINWSSSRHINKTNATNKMMVQKVKNIVSFFVNDQLLGSITFQRFYGNQFGITVYQNQKIEVSEFAVYGTPTDTKLEASKPDVKLSQFAINDGKNEAGESLGNGNYKVEAGESIEVSAYLQNFGFGDAKNISAEVFLNSTSQYVSYPDKGKTYPIGTIESGDYKKLEFYFFTSSRFAQGMIPFTIKLTDNKTKYSAEVPLSIELNKQLPSLAEVSIKKMDIRKQASVKNINEVVEPSDVDKDIPKTKVDGSNTLVIVLGIEDYKYAPKVDFAKRDALMFYNYALSMFGVPEKNIYFKTNEEATLGEFQKIFTDDGWLSRRVKKDITNVIVYYAGHGAPDLKTKDAFIIPYDIDPNYAKTGFGLEQMYRSLSDLGAKSVTVFVDACFSGTGRSAEMLIEGSRTVRIKPQNSVITGKNMAVFTASSGEQYSGSYPEKGHGIFTYYLLKGLKGEAKTKGKAITVDQLFNYLQKNVIQQASALDKEQTPTLDGTNKDRVLIEY